MPIFNTFFDFMTNGFKFLGNSNWAFLGLSITSILIVLYTRKQSKIQYNFLDTIFFSFSLIFFASLFMRQAPYGFIEYSTLFSGYFLYKFFQVKKIKIPNIAFYLFYLVNILSIIHFYISDFDRLYGLTNFNQTLTTYPNFWALIMGIVLISNFQNKKYFLTLITSISFFLTLSKTSILSMFIVVLLLLFFSFKKKNFTVVLKNLGVLFIGMILSLGLLNAKSLNSFVEERLTNNSISSQNSFNQRFIFFKQSLQMFKDFSVLGVGPGNFKSLQPTYAKEFYVLSDHPHNIGLKILSENGLLLTFITIFAGLIYLLLNIQNPINPFFLSIVFVLGQSQFDYNLNFSLSVIVCSFLLAKSTALKLKSYKFSNKFFNILLIQFIIVIMVSSIDLLNSKINNRDFLFLENGSNPNLSIKYPKFWKFNPSKFSELSPYDNLDLHLDFAPNDKSDYSNLLEDVIRKTKVNYNFLVLDDEIPYALKLACFYDLKTKFKDLKLAYTKELGKLNLNHAKQKYENTYCN
ncbi:hypothetical protein CL656_01405 [bacterium]|nr:hypothetical protein [bacterium]|tara:strand:+ start:2547 stop:4106 length:1560 start_codon:yes stop_codon:yes gene_type:complete